MPRQTKQLIRGVPRLRGIADGSVFVMDAYVASRELGSRTWPDDARPDRADADEMVRDTFADHAMVNVADRATGGAVQRERSPGGPQSFVIAEIVLRPELVPIREGGLFPDVTDEVLGEPHLVYAARWPHASGSDEGRVAADELLQLFIGTLPVHLWRQDV